MNIGLRNELFIKKTHSGIFSGRPFLQEMICNTMGMLMAFEIGFKHLPFNKILSGPFEASIMSLEKIAPFSQLKKWWEEACEEASI